MKHITTGLFCQSITLCIFGEERCLCLKNHTLDKAKNKILKMIDNCYKLLQQMQCLCFSRILPKLDSADLAVCGSKSAQVNVQPRQCTEKYGKERREPWFMEFLTTRTKYGCFSAVEILATQSILWVWMWHSILFWSFFFFFSPLFCHVILRFLRKIPSWQAFTTWFHCQLHCWGGGKPLSLECMKAKGEKAPPPPNNRQQINTASTN